MEKLNLKKPSKILKSILPLIEESDLRFNDIRLHNLGLMYVTGKKTKQEIENETINLEKNLNDKESDELSIFLDALHSFQEYGIGAMLEELDLKPVNIEDTHDNLAAICINIECLENVINNSIRELEKHGY